MSHACFVPDCFHTRKDDSCRRVGFPKSPIRKASWISAIARADMLPTHSSRVCVCHFPDGIKGYHLRKTPSIFKRNLEHSHLFRDCKKFTRKKLLEYPLTLNDSIERDVSPPQASGILSAQRSSLSNWGQSLGVRSLGDEIVHLDDHSYSSKEVPLRRRSTPNILSPKRQKQEEEQQQHEQEHLQEESCGFQEQQTQKQNRAADGNTPSIRTPAGEWVFLNQETSKVLNLWSPKQLKDTASQTTRVCKNAHTQVSRAALSLVRNVSAQTNNLTTEDASCQTPVIMFDTAEAFRTFGDNVEVFKYLITDNQEWRDKLYKMELAKKDSDAQCETLSARVRQLEEVVQNLEGNMKTTEEDLKGKLLAMTTKYCTAARRILELEGLF